MTENRPANLPAAHAPLLPAETGTGVAAQRVIDARPLSAHGSYFDPAGCWGDGEPVATPEQRQA